MLSKYFPFFVLLFILIMFRLKSVYNLISGLRSNADICTEFELLSSDKWGQGWSNKALRQRLMLLIKWIRCWVTGNTLMTTVLHYIVVYYCFWLMLSVLVMSYLLFLTPHLHPIPKGTTMEISHRTLFSFLEALTF